MSITCGALHAGRKADTITVTFSAKLTGFDIDYVPVKILLAFGFVGNMALALFTRVS
jgi:hypothetical protein